MRKNINLYIIACKSLASLRFVFEIRLHTFPAKKIIYEAEIIIDNKRFKQLKLSILRLDFLQMVFASLEILVNTAMIEL